MGASSSKAPLSSKLSAREVARRCLEDSGQHDLRGRVFIVTGANCGIGKETARALVALKATVILACRNEKTGKSAEAELNSEYPKSTDTAAEDDTTATATEDDAAAEEDDITTEKDKLNVAGEDSDCAPTKPGSEEATDTPSSTSSNSKGYAIFMSLDLADLASIQRFVATFLALDLPLHCLVNNAGVAPVLEPKVGVTAQGYEITFGVNHLGTFFLTYLLLDKMKASAPARIVTVSSVTSKWSKLTAENFDEYPIHPPTSDQNSFTLSSGYYFHSKLLNVLFAKKLHRLLEGTGVTSYSLHPGYVQTNLGQNRENSMPFYTRISIPLSRLFFIPAERGAATSVYCALHPEAPEHSGGYFDSCEAAEPHALAHDESVQDRLWALSVDLVEKFTRDEKTE